MGCFFDLRLLNGNSETKVKKIYLMSGPISCQDVALSPQDLIENPGNLGRDFAEAITKKLIAQIGADRFELWFSDPDCITVEQTDEATSDQIETPIDPTQATTVSVFAETKFSLLRIQNTFGADLRSIVNQVGGPHFRVEYKVQDSTADSSTETVEATAPKISVIENSNSHDSRDQHSEKAKPKTGSNSRTQGVNSFWFGKENRLIEAGVDQLFERPGQFSPFFIYGPTGSGKSHLVESITTDFRRKLRMKRCVYISAEQFTSQFVSSLRGGTGLPLFRRKYRDLDLLAIDDIQFLAGKRATLGEFQHTIDNLIRIGKQIIVTSDRPPIELGHLGNDISARLSGGLTCPLEYPDLEGRVKIVRRMCTERNMSMPTNVINLICEQLTRDVRRLSGAVNRLHAYSVSMRQPMTPEVATQVLRDLFSLSGPNCTSMVSIEEAVCDFCGLKPAELKSPSRQKRISSARMLAMYLSRQYTGSAFSEIGEYFGGRSHSTAIAAEKKVAQWIENNDGISLANAVYPAKEVVRRIESNLRIG